MIFLLLKSVFISIISTTAINMIYKIDNIVINSGLIIAIVVIAFLSIKKDEEEKMNNLFEERKQQLEVNKEDKNKFKEYIQSYISEIKDSNISLTNAIEETNNKLINNIDDQIINLYNVIKSQEEKVSSINKTINTIVDIKSNGNSANKLLEEQYNVISNFKKIFEENMKLHYEQKVELKKLISDYSIQTNENSLKIKELIEININSELSDICEIARKQEEKIDSIDNKVSIIEEINMNIDSVNKGLEDQSRTINKFKKIVEESIEAEQEQKEELLNAYKKIYNESFKQIAELTNKNQYIVQLLMDNYKVLNAVIDN